MKRIINKRMFSTLVSLILLSSVNAQVGINTQEPITTLDVGGDFTIRETHNLSKNSNILYVDSDGKIGLKPLGSFITDNVFFATSDVIVMSNLGTSFNNGTMLTLPFSEKDIVYNTIGIESVGPYFKVTKDGLYQVDGFTNFFITTPLGYFTSIVVSIETSVDNGQTWGLITGSSSAFDQSWAGGQNHPHNIPTAISFLSSNSLLRLSFHRGFKAEAPSQGLGSPVQNLRVSADVDYATKSYQLVIQKL